MNYSVIQIEGIHADAKIHSKSEHSTDWWAILTIKDNNGNKVEIFIDNGSIVDGTYSSNKHK